MLRFFDLRDNLRQLLWSRIESGELTGMMLAEKTGFRQAHISNFLNRKRGLSFEGIDRILGVEDLSIFDLIDPEEINAHASVPPPPDSEYANVFLVPANVAGRRTIHARDVEEVLKFRHSLLKRMKAEPTKKRAAWQRFVMIRPSKGCCEAMASRLAPGCMVLLDRHCHTLNGHRRGERPIYAVLRDGEVLVRYVHREGDLLLLEPESREAHTTAVKIGSATPAEDLIIGRAAYVGTEL